VTAPDEPALVSDGTDGAPRLRIFGVEINAVMHCNLACAGCSHASPLSASWCADPEIVLRDLAVLHSVADIDEVRVVGGEPLLHPRFSDLLAAIAAAGVGGTVRVITNGTRLRSADLSWLPNASEVYVSVYPGTAVSGEAIDRLRARAAQAGTKVAVNRFTHFRPVLPRQPLTCEEAAAVFETCQVAHSWSCHTVQEGFIYLCPMTVPERADGGNSASRCALEPRATLAARLHAFLGPRGPLPQCRSCLGTVGQLTPHRQASRKTWLTLSTSGIDWEHVKRVRADPWAASGCVDNSVPLPL
jgi:organic radical activating enzyme